MKTASFVHSREKKKKKHSNIHVQSNKLTMASLIYNKSDFRLIWLQEIYLNGSYLYDNNNNNNTYQYKLLVINYFTTKMKLDKTHSEYRALIKDTYHVIYNVVICGMCCVVWPQCSVMEVHKTFPVCVSFDNPSVNLKSLCAGHIPPPDPLSIYAELVVIAQVPPEAAQSFQGEFRSMHHKPFTSECEIGLTKWSVYVLDIAGGHFLPICRWTISVAQCSEVKSALCVHIQTQESVSF